MELQNIDSFIIFSAITLILLTLFEIFLAGSKKVIYHIPVSELSGLKEKASKELQAKKIIDTTIQSVSKDIAKVTVTYKK